MVISKGAVTLRCDRADFYQSTSVAVASGHVVVVSDQGEIRGEKINFNFVTMSGEFVEAKYIHDPLYGESELITKVGDNQINLEKGYLTTCDHDKPHFRLASKKIEVYPGEKAVARNVRLIIGKVPILFIPRFTQRLDEKKPWLTIIPGYTKDWGIFLLTGWRYQLHENLKGTVHLDYRERKDFASGVDVDYKIPNMGSGIMRTYYMNERNISSKRTWQVRLRPTVERERFKGEWRHQWKIDDRTDAILQYYKLSDKDFLKDYFEREFEKDPDPETFFQLTHALPNGALSFRTDKRVNRHSNAIERLPEIKLDISNQEIGNTGLYLKNATTYSNLSSKTAAPSFDRKETMRIDVDNEVSYPFKISIIELRPFVGGRETYYSKTKFRSKYNTIRGIFRSGASLSTKFYRVYDFHTAKWDLDINRLRHIFTPSVSYLYQHDPTFPSSQLDIFDGIDSITQEHRINFAFENKLQTKRKNKSEDIVRTIIDTDYLLKEHPGKPGFNSVRTSIEVYPRKGLTFSFDSNYDLKGNQLATANFELNLKEDKWSFDLGKRFSITDDDQVTAGFSYRINPKWAFKIYERYDTRSGTQKEQEFSVTRDLHEWEMDLNFNETRGHGSEIWLVFRLKSFPDFMFDFGTGFNKRKAGSQSGE